MLYRKLSYTINKLVLEFLQLPLSSSRRTGIAKNKYPWEYLLLPVMVMFTFSAFAPLSYGSVYHLDSLDHLDRFDKQKTVSESNKIEFYYNNGKIIDESDGTNISSYLIARHRILRTVSSLTSGIGCSVLVNNKQDPEPGSRNLAPSTQNQEPGTQWLISNGKDVVATTDGSVNGNGTALSNYTPYGEDVDFQSESLKNQSNIQNPTSNINTNPFKYSGYYSDAESGLYYLNARYYSPELMRFINRDSYDLSNRYAYCDSDPISRTDPNGHMSDRVKSCLLAMIPGYGIYHGIETMVDGDLWWGGLETGIGIATTIPVILGGWQTGKCLCKAIKQMAKVAPASTSVEVAAERTFLDELEKINSETMKQFSMSTSAYARQYQSTIEPERLAGYLKAGRRATEAAAKDFNSADCNEFDLLKTSRWGNCDEQTMNNFRKVKEMLERRDISDGATVYPVRTGGCFGVPDHVVLCVNSEAEGRFYLDSWAGKKVLSSQESSFSILITDRKLTNWYEETYNQMGKGLGRRCRLDESDWSMEKW